MSWSRRNRERAESPLPPQGGGCRIGARCRRFFTLVAVVLMLGACGFEPLYARHDGDGVAARLETIQIEPIADRVGQMLHNRLRDGLAPRGLPAKPLYYLKVTVIESVQESVIQRTAFAAQANLSLNISYQLHDAKSRGAVLSGSVRSTSSYRYQTAALGTLAGEKDARERAVADAAEEIRARLALYFKRDALDSKQD